MWKRKKKGGVDFASLIKTDQITKVCEFRDCNPS